MANMVSVARGRTKAFRAPDIKISRSQFNMSMGRKMTFDASYLYPVIKPLEVLPGDTWTHSLNGIVRMFSPLDSPMMDNVAVETFWFFVPTRLLWSNWQYFQGEHDAAGAQDTTYTVPVLASGTTVNHDGSTYGTADLAAYFGIPHGLQTGSVDINCLPFRAYNLIYNEWFRDQNLQDEISANTNDGPDASNFNIRKSAKKHDYFTSALPYLQKGDAQAAALSGVLEVYTEINTTDPIAVFSTTEDDYQDLNAGAADLTLDTTVADVSEVLKVKLDGIGGSASSSAVGTVDINALRYAVAIQRLLERDARGGTRYTEIIKSHFGVTSPDFRLQRPEYLGGGKSFINVSPVSNTSGVDSTASISGADEPQGELRGVGAGVMRGHGWAKSFTEHGYIIGLIRARGDLTYFQGLDRLWSRASRYDFYLPALANLGEQSILNKEIYVSNSSAIDDATFAFQARWEEYRQNRSEVVGKFNPDVSGALSEWHLAEDFSSLPSLNSAFIVDSTPMSRVLTVTSEPDFLADIWFNLKAARPLPVTSIPSLLGMRF